MTGKRVGNVLENGACIKGKLLLGISPVDIHSEMCYFHGECKCLVDQIVVS